MTPAKIVSVNTWIDFKLCFIRLSSNNSCNTLSIYDFPGAVLITSYTLQSSQWSWNIRMSFYMPGKQGLERLT